LGGSLQYNNAQALYKNSKFGELKESNFIKSTLTIYMKHVISSNFNKILNCHNIIEILTSYNMDTTRATAHKMGTGSGNIKYIKIITTDITKNDPTIVSR